MKPSLQEEIRQQNSGTTTTRTKPSSSSNTKQEQQQQQEQQEVLKCPRCDSSNTKFCYYNNYSLTQPRHFCKTCRRYWTKGGALRNVPIGGGCRKNKKLKSSSSCSSSSNSYSKFFTPSIDFQLNNGGGLSFPRSCFALDLDHHHQTSPTNNYSFMGNNNFPLNLQGTDNNNNNNNLNIASSIESLSSLNQDLHWKLQQQRLAMIFGDDDHHHHQEVQNKDQNQKFLQPILFQNLEIPKQDNDSCCFTNHHPTKECDAAASTTAGDATTATEWFFGNNNSSYDHHHHQVMSTTNISRNIIGGNNAGGSSWNNNNGGVQAWEDLQHFTPLP